MKCLYHTHYRFYKPDTKTTPSFLLLSDIHFSTKVQNDRLSALLKHATKLRPNYILIPGDLIDSLESIDAPHDRQRLFTWLTELGAIAPVFICLGNHDFYRTNPAFASVFSRKQHWYAELSYKYIKDLNQLPNVHCLHNAAYEDKQVYIFGLTVSPDYYQFDHDGHTTTFLHPGDEHKDVLLDDLNNIPTKQLHDLPRRKAKIALIHPPYYLDDPEIAPFFADFDFVIAGHMHNGLVPPVVHDFWRSDRGIYAPGKHFFRQKSRARITSPDQKTIICGAVSTFQKSAKPLTFLNSIYPVNTALLEFTHQSRFARKPDVRNKYISF